MSHDFRLSDVLDLIGHNPLHALVAVLLVAGLIWAVSPHNSPAHRLAVPVFIGAAAAVILTAVVRAISMWM